MKFKTVREGQQAVIFNHMGEGRLVVGPQRVFLFRERLTFLKEYTANPYQYLVVRDNEGSVRHMRGPCNMFENPLLHGSVSVQNSTKIDANHMIVVYKRLKDSDVQRRIIQGPTVFVPEAEEWVHSFKWHGNPPDDKARMVPGLNTFTQLAAIPDQFYYNVREVRTLDDTMIKVKLMLFYELSDVMKMLDTTNDPIADMINAVCSDVIAYAGKITFEEFLNRTQELGNLSSFPQLVQRAEKIGYKIQKVVFRGYHASDQLQIQEHKKYPDPFKRLLASKKKLTEMMQNSAIESRTKLRLNAEIEEQKQKLADFKLSKEQERSKLVQEMEKAKQEHNQKTAGLKQKHHLELQEMQHEQKLKILSLTTQAKLDFQTAEDRQKLEFLENLKKLSIDLTQYLTNQEEPSVNEEIRVVSSTSV